jgi:hypothetical protein
MVIDCIFVKLRRFKKFHFVKHYPDVSSEAPLLIFAITLKYTIGQSFLDS